jgi:hypothetical protein
MAKNITVGNAVDVLALAERYSAEPSNHGLSLRTYFDVDGEAGGSTVDQVCALVTFLDGGPLHDVKKHN